jgi:alpha-galactosidase
MRSFSLLGVYCFYTLLIEGVDYLKYDKCGHDKSGWQERYDAMRNALLNYWEQPILYALCEKGKEKVWKWGNETGHTWRITPDIRP